MKLIESFSQTLPSQLNRPRRSALFAKLDIGEYDQWFVLTHLEHNEWPSSSEALRMRQIEVIEQTAAERLDGEPILFGDLNIMPGGEAHDRLDANYDDAFETLGIGHVGTFKGRPGMRRLDYIMFDEDLQFDVIAGGRLESSASDHDPILVIGTPQRG